MAAAEQSPETIEVESILLGEHIDVRAVILPEFETVVAIPRILRGPGNVLIAIFRFGAIVIARPGDTRSFDPISAIAPQVRVPFQTRETESAKVAIGSPDDPTSQQSGVFVMSDFSAERFAVLASALAKSVALARDERNIASVFERLEPFSQQLAQSGGQALTSRAPLKLLGDALLAQHRMVGRVEASEKPDILWDQPDLLRLHTRLDDEYELSERATILSRKLKVVEESASAIAEIANSYMSHRLEIAIIALIAFEIALSIWGLARGLH